MDAEKTFLDSLAMIERIAGNVARRHGLNADESAEFVQSVRVKLFDDDYAIVRKFKGESKFSTYLHVVIDRLFQQCRVEMWGKWRPSAEAKRLGHMAVTLERLLTRDGFTFDEAVKILTVRTDAPYSVAELEAVYIRLPLRNPRPVLVPDDGSADAVAVESDADDRVESSDRARVLRRAAETLDRVIATFEPEDRLILEFRFWHGRKVPEIARLVHIDQKKIYKRLDKLFATLRRALEDAGVSRADIDKFLGRGDEEIHLGIFPPPPDDPPPSSSSPAMPSSPRGGTPPFGPSNPTGEEVRGGPEDRLP